MDLKVEQVQVHFRLQQARGKIGEERNRVGGVQLRTGRGAWADEHQHNEGKRHANTIPAASSRHSG
jgi:hypothetical protein